MLKELLTTFVISASASGVDVTPHNATTIPRQTSDLSCKKYVLRKIRSQGLAGQLAVSLVVLNRVKDDRFPNTICEVVHQALSESLGKLKVKLFQKSQRTYFPIRNRCQFSWYCDGKSDEPKEPTTYGALYDMALDLVYGDITVVDITEGATHYHADYVYPAWRKTKTKTIEIEDHIFYRWEK